MKLFLVYFIDLFKDSKEFHFPTLSLSPFPPRPILVESLNLGWVQLKQKLILGSIWAVAVSASFI